MKALGAAALVRGHCCGSQHEAGGMSLADHVWSVKCGHHRGWCPAGGAGGKLDLANGGPPGAGGCRLGRRAVWCCPLGRCINIELLFALPIALVGD